MKLTFQIILLIIFFSITAFGQNEDFEASSSGTLTTSNQVSGWTVTSGVVVNVCNIQNCCPNPPAESAIISAPGGYLDARVPFPVYSVFGATANNGFINGLGTTSGNSFLRLGGLNSLSGIEVATKSITVTPGNALLQLAFLSVMQQSSHSCCDSPTFMLRLTNASTGSQLVCPGFSLTPNSNLCAITPQVPFNTSPSAGWVYNDWYVAAIDLSPYMGQVIVIQVSANDCTAGGHAGYAYVDARCRPMTLTCNQAPVTLSTPTAIVNTCGAATSTLIVPPGLGLYSWAGPNTTLSENTPLIANQVFTITTPGTYTLTMQPLGACGPLTKIITLNALPAGTINVAGPSTLCANNSATLVANGAISYTWSTGSNSSTIITTPTATAVFTVTGINANGCWISTNFTLNLVPLPIVTASGNTTVCAGTGSSFTFSGASSYLWNGSLLPGNTVSVIPANTTAYTLTGTGSGCTNTLLVSLTTVTTCANVWPGDANSDGIANNLDILELGLHMGQTGAARAQLSNTWQSWYANTWNGTITGGKNVCHADCNGDGVINLADTAAVFLNYGSVHSFYRSNAVSSNADLYLQADQPFVNAGNWGSASLFLGDNSNSVNLNGLAFTLNFDKTFLETDSVGLSYSLSFLNAGNNLNFNKKFFTNGMVYSASTHTNNSNVTGNGKIATFYFKVKNFLNADTVMNVLAMNAYKSTANGLVTPLISGNAGIVLRSLSTGITRTSGSEAGVCVYPNPANHQVNVRAPYELQKVEIFTLDGKLMMVEPSAKQTVQTINLSALSNGMYLIKVTGNKNQTAIRKLVLTGN